MCNTVDGKMQRSVRKIATRVREKFRAPQENSLAIAMIRLSEMALFYRGVPIRDSSLTPVYVTVFVPDTLALWAADSLPKRRVCRRARCRCNRGIELLLCGEKELVYMRGGERKIERERGGSKVGSIEVLFHFRAAFPGGFDIVNASVYSASLRLFCVHLTTRGLLDILGHTSCRTAFRAGRCIKFAATVGPINEPASDCRYQFSL